MPKDSIASDRRSTDQLLRKVAAGIRDQQARLHTLLDGERGRLEKQLADRVGRGRDELRGSLTRLRQLQQTRGGGSLLSRVQALVPTTPKGLSRLRPSRRVARRSKRVILRVDGRRIVLRAAHRTDLERARRGLAQHDARLHAALTADARALAELTANHERLAQIVEQLQAKRYMAWILEIFDRLSSLDLRSLRLRRRHRKLRRANRSTRMVAQQQAKVVDRKLTRLTRDARINVVRKAAMTMQTAAFGTRGDLLARNNLVLAGNEVAWGLGGDVVGADAAGWLTPAGSLVTGSVVADPNAAGQPAPTFDPIIVAPGPSRFISGVAVGTDWALDGNVGARATVDLQPIVPAELWPAFSMRVNVPVMLQIVSPVAGVLELWGNVVTGVLTIITVFPFTGPTVTAIIDGGLQGRWVIDLLAPSVDPGPEPFTSVIP